MKWIEKEGYSTRLLAGGSDIGCGGCEIQLIRFRKGKYSHYHRKKTEFFYFTGGCGKVIVDGKEKNISEGTVIIVKPNQRHIFVNESKEVLEAVMVKTNNDPEDTFTD